MKKILAMMLMAASVLFLACSEDEEEMLSPDQAKTELNQVSTDMSTYMTDMENSDGMKALNALMGKPDPFSVTKSVKYTNVFKNIQEYLLPANYLNNKSDEKGVAEERFNFDAWVGTYTWNIANEKWDIQSNSPSDKIIINYPTEGSQSNNATLTIHNYLDVELTEIDDYGTYTWYEPTKIVADIYVNNIEVVDISMDATWNKTGEAIGDIADLNADVYLIPFDFTVVANHSGNGFSIDSRIIYENTQILSAGISSLFDDVSMEGTPVNISGYVQLLKVKFDASINAKNLETIIDTMESDNPPYASYEEAINAVNNEFDAYVSIGGAKAADIEIGMNETTQSPDILFVYSDGSTEPAQPYFSSFIAEIDAFLTSLENYYSNW